MKFIEQKGLSISPAPVKKQFIKRNNKKSKHVAIALFALVGLSFSAMASTLVSPDDTLIPGPGCTSTNGIIFHGLTFENQIEPFNQFVTQYTAPNAGIVFGTAVDVVVTLDSPPAPSGNSFPTTSNGDFTFNTADSNGNRLVTVQFVEAGTNIPVVANYRIRMGDIDANEAVSFDASQFVQLIANNPTNLTITEAGGITTVMGTGGFRPTVDQDTLELILVGASSFTYTAIPSSGNTGFSIDADLSLPLSTVDCMESADLSVTKDNGATSIIAGGNVSYTIVASNAGADPVIDAEITDTVTAPLQNCTYTAVGTGAASGFTASGSGSIADTGVSLASGESVTYTMSCTVDSATTDLTLTNTVSINSPIVPDPDTTNDSATDTDTIAHPVVADDDAEENTVIGTPTTVDVLDGDTDLNGNTTIDPTTVTIVSLNATDTDGDGIDDQLIVVGEGTWDVDPVTGEITFTPEAGFTGDPTPIVYTVDDVDGNTSNEATVSVTYNASPVADNDGGINPVIGTPTAIDVLGNDSDPDGNLDPATVQIAGTVNPGDPLVIPGEGTWTVDPSSGIITFTPEPGFTDDPTVITYTVADNEGNISNPATVTIMYGDAPVAVDDNVSNPIIGSPTPVNILLNDNDLDGTVDSTTVQIVGTANAGDPLVVLGEGVWTVDPASGIITFTPEPGFTGDPTPIQYTVMDDVGNTSNPAAVNVDYGDAPNATPDGAANPNPGTPTTVNVLGNDNDPDGNLDPTTVQILDVNGDPVSSLVVPGEGVWVVDPLTGAITFTPEAGFIGDPAPISYTVMDNDGNISPPAAVTVTYGDSPVATDDMQLNPVIGSDTVVSVLANDDDPDGTVDPTTVEIVGATGGSLVVPGQGTWTVDPLTGDIIFSPELGFTGDPDPIEYTVEDNNGNISNPATITVTYGEAPVATNDVEANPVIGTPTTVNLVSNDGDSDGNIDLNSVQLVGTANPGDPLVVPNEGVWTIIPGTGMVTFTPDPGFTGDPSPISYTLSDNDGNVSNEATVTVTYGEPPVADNDGAANPLAGTPTEINVLANDSDIDGTLDPATVQISGTANPGDPLVVVGEGTWTVDPITGAITFTPEPGFIGDPTVIRYTVADNDGNTSEPATVTVTYGEPPMAVDNNASNPVVGSPTEVNILLNDSDLDGGVDPTTVQIVGTTNPGDPLVVAGEGEWTVDPTTGAITFTPEPGFTGDPTPILYTVMDDDGNTSNPAAVNVDYGDAPIATPDGAANPNPGTPTVINVFANDNDPDGTVDPTTVQILDPLGNPVTTLVVPGEGTWVVNPLTGEITFTPEPGFIGDPAPISYTVEDDAGNISNPATITVTYGDGAAATDDMQFNPLVGSDTVVNVLSNDNDPDGNLDPATVQIAGTANPGDPLVIPGQGTWSIDPTTGAITFSPEAGFIGDPDPIQYTVDDNDGNTSNPATVTVTYGEAPVATDDAIENPTIGSPTTIDLVSNDGDSDGSIDLDSVQLVGTTNPGDPLTVAGEGVWTVNPGTGSITFTPEPGFIGDPTPIGYTVSDNSGNVSNEATVTVTYGPPPVVLDDTAINPLVVSSGGVTIIDVLGASNADPDSVIDPATVDLDPSTPGIQSTFTNADGIYEVDPAGVVTFTPAPGLSTDPQPIDYTASDIFGNVSNVAQINVVFGQAPIAVDDVANPAVTANSGESVIIDVISGSDNDPDNVIDPSTVDLDPTTPGIDNIFTNADGTYTVDAAGLVTFTPIDGLTTSPEPISYTVSDIFGNVSNAALITINFAPPRPTDIPTLSEWMLVMLTLMLMFLGHRESTRKSKGFSKKF